MSVQLVVIHSWFTVGKRIWTNTFNLPCCIYEDFGYDGLRRPASSWDSTFHSELLLDERKSYFCAKEKCPPCLQKLPHLMPLHRIGRAAAYCKRLPVAFCVRCVASFPSILLKIVLLKGHSAASVCDSPARIMKPQETRIQSGAKSFRTPTTTSVSLKTHTYVRDIQSAAGVKSLDPWPLFGPMRTSSTGGARPRRQPINSRQFRRRREGGSISKINDSPLHAFCYFFLFYRAYLLSLSSHLLRSAVSLHCAPLPQRSHGHHCLRMR